MRTGNSVRGVGLVMLGLVSLGTACSPPPSPPGGPRAPHSVLESANGQPLPAEASPQQEGPEEYLDQNGRKWTKKGKARIGEWKLDDKDRVRDAPTPVDPRDLPIEQLAGVVRTRKKVGGDEYQLSWPDSLELARTIKAARIERSEAGDAQLPQAEMSGGVERTTVALVVGLEDRQNYNSVAAASPHKKVAALSHVGGGGKCTCEKLVNNYTCVTAAHCLMGDDGLWKPDFMIRFAAGAGAGARNAFSSGCAEWTVPGDWPGDQSYDYGVLSFRGNGANCPYNEYNVGWFGWQELPPSLGPSWVWAQGAGYPGTPPNGWSYPTLTYDYDSNNYYYGIGWLYHSIDTTGGQSGMGIFDGSWYLNAIHRGGSGSINIAARVWSSTYSWMASNAGF